MSTFWDKYLAPGDIRKNHAPSPTTPIAQDNAPTPPRAGPQSTRIDAAGRQRRQDALLYGGALFTIASLFITRRALNKKLAALPYGKPINASTNTIIPSPTNTPTPKTDGPMDAAEALGLATLNVVSIAMLAAGAASKIFDIADVEDLRDGVRKGVGFDVYGGDSEADKEMEAWVADVLARKDGQGDFKESIAVKLKELEEMDRRKGGPRGQS